MAEDKRRPMAVETYTLVVGTAIIFAIFFLILAVVPSAASDIGTPTDPAQALILRALYTAATAGSLALIIFVLLRRRPEASQPGPPKEGGGS